MIMVMLEMMMVLMMMGMMLGMMMQQVSNEANGRCAGISSGPNLLTLKSCTYLNSVHTYILYILTFYILVYLHLVPKACQFDASWDHLLCFNFTTFMFIFFAFKKVLSDFLVFEIEFL